MIAFIKALVPGSLLTWIVCLFIGSAGSSGGFLHIHYLTVGDYSLFWSWPLFSAGTLLAWFILSMLE